MRSEFLTFVGNVFILDSIFHHQLLQDSDWYVNVNQKPRRYFIKLLKYSKDNY